MNVSNPARAELAPRLVLDRLTKSYGATRVVDDVSLAVGKGEFVCLLGPSGCGKTTTLQMIAGFVDTSAGAIWLDGQDVSRQPAHQRGLGIVFQSYALFPHMSVAENVGFGLEMRQVPDTERTKRVSDALELVHLGGYGDRYPRQLSGGQQQRVALARALVIKPSILLLDEPLSNLDAKLREEMQAELRRIHRSLGVTTIMVTHDQSEALALADRIAIMNAGRIEQIGPPGEVYDRPTSRFVASFLGKANFLRATMLGVEGGFSILSIEGREFRIPVLPSQRGTELVFSLRPEKTYLVPAGQGHLSGKVVARIFQGSTWFCEVEIASGTLLIEQANQGAPPSPEGEAVDITFEVSDLRLLAGEAP